MNEIAEAELYGAGRDGAIVDGSTAGGKRLVRAAVLRKCCDELKDQIHRRGLRLENTVVDGCVDLAGLAVPFPLRFSGCEFDSPLVVEGADLFELSLTGCVRLPGLLGNGLRIRRDLDLSRCRIAGAHRTSASTSRGSAIWLCESEIGGRLLCVDTVIDGQGQRAYAIDTVLPLISLDQRSTWYPDPSARYGTFMQWWLNTATLLGWLLSSIFVLSLARLARTT